jgi:Type VIII secretion system (T8SS), CsgF protein
MRKIVFFFSIVMMVATPVCANQMTFGFKNPEFSGDGYSSHALTIENEEYTRRKAREAEQKAAADAAASAANNTNLNKFLNNLESRIYAQLSLQLSNAMFADGATTGTMQFEGSTLTWLKDTVNQTITLTVIDASGNRTDVTVPIGSFKF